MSEIHSLPPHDPVRFPIHYTDSEVDWRKVADDWKLSWRLTHALKYLRRHTRKGIPVEDLRKLIQYVNMEIDRLERKSGRIPIEEEADVK